MRSISISFTSVLIVGAIYTLGARGSTTVRLKPVNGSCEPSDIIIQKPINCSLYHFGPNCTIYIDFQIKEIYQAGGCIVAYKYQ